MSLVLWLHINEGVALIDPWNIQTCIHLLIEFYSYLPIHIHRCWISAAIFYCYILLYIQIFIFVVFYFVFLFQKFSKIKIALWFTYYLISFLIIFIWMIVVRSLNYKRVVSSWDILILSNNKHLVVLKKLLVLLQNLEYSCVRNLKIFWNYWLIDLAALIQNLLYLVLWYWRTAWIKSLDESISNIKWSSWCCWLVYK